MQKQTCREFAEAHQWEIVKEVLEKGVSGFKVSAKDRDAIQEIQHDAVLGKFDILLVFMFDRLGRREDETPFVVEWFVENGIEVWSSVEGQQRFDNHTDKLMNYIRYWQASGESIKTSIRTKTRLGQIVQEGHFRGGICPYGYELNKRGRLGKKNRELYEIEVNDTEAIIVKKIFERCVHHGYGGRRIASTLQEQGIVNRSGEVFHYSSVQSILRNIMYKGILRSGESQSDMFPDLQIISQDIFDRAQQIIAQRAVHYNEQKDAPRTTVGRALLSGNIYCGHCGGRIFASTARKSHHPPVDGLSPERIPIYKCYNRTQHKTVCDGPCSYRAYKVDVVIREMLQEVFAKAKGVRESDLVDKRYADQMNELTVQLKKAKTDYSKKSKELFQLDGMLMGAVDGTGLFTPERLTRRMDAVEAELEQIKDIISTTEIQIQQSSELLTKIRQEHQQLLSWADMFADVDIEVQKMVTSYVIKRVTVGANYELDVEWNIDEGQFVMGMG